MSSLQEWLQVVHVLAAIVWMGGSATLLLLGSRAMRGDITGKAGFARGAEVAGKMYAISGAVILIAGMWLVADSDVWEFSDGFVSLGIATVIIGAVLGAAFFGPQSVKAATAYEAGDEAVGDALVKRIVIVARIEMLLLVVTVWAMVTNAWV